MYYIHSRPISLYMIVSTYINFIYLGLVSVHLTCDDAYYSIQAKVPGTTGDSVILAKVNIKINYKQKLTYISFNNIAKRTESFCRQSPPVPATFAYMYINVRETSKLSMLNICLPEYEHIFKHVCTHILSRNHSYSALNTKFM